MTTTTLPAIDHLSADAKRQLLALLARDLMSASGEVSVTDAGGELMVYAIPSDSPVRKEELAARLQRLDTAIPLPEVIADLRQQAARLQTPQLSPCAPADETTAATP